MEREDAILQGLLELAEKTEINNSYQKPYEITKDTDIWFVMLPQWSHFLPPFNLARLSSILLEEGYFTKCLDLNIKAWNISRPYIDELGYDPWDGSWTFKWKGDNYWNELHKYFSDFFNQALEEIVKAKPKVIGFTVYWTNTVLVLWMKRELKKRLPDTIFVAGGPSSHSDAERLRNNFDVTVVGEAEKIIVSLLDSIEDGTLDKTTFPLKLTQPFNERIDLNIHPIPNYSDFDTNDYKIPNGMISEFSRGCVAKCTFCEETHFWNFRQRGYLSLVDELEHLNKQFGFNGVWFVDSLVNGSIKELRAFAEEVVNRNLKIQWFGFARHDGRMDLEYLKLLKASGCVALQYGSESGSNKVLIDINKRVTREEMEQNFIDGHIAGVLANTSWIIGFPTETINDFVDTLTLIWRNRNTSIANIISSTRFHLGSQTIVGQNPKKFGIMHSLYENCHIREDLTMGLPQLTVRSKCWTMFLEELKSNRTISFLPRPDFKKYHYSLKYNDRKRLTPVDFETFDYKIYNTDNPWIDSIINEPFGFFRFLWKSRGGYKLQLNFSKELQQNEYGPSLSPDLSGRMIFEIDDLGNWIYDVDLKYIQLENAWTTLPKSYYFGEESSIKRARKHAKPEWGIDGITKEDYTELCLKTEELNKSLDLSFEIQENLKASWVIKKQDKNLF